MKVKWKLPHLAYRIFLSQHHTGSDSDGIELPIHVRTNNKENCTSNWSFPLNCIFVWAFMGKNVILCIAWSIDVCFRLNSKQALCIIVWNCIRYTLSLKVKRRENKKTMFSYAWYVVANASAYSVINGVLLTLQIDFYHIIFGCDSCYQFPALPLSFVSRIFD